MAAKLWDALAMVHGDLRKLADAAELDRRNLPQAVVLVGYDRSGGTLGARVARFARDHGLEQWSRPGNGIQVLDLPVSPGHQHYAHAIVDVWARQDKRTKVLDCGGRCHLVGS